MRCCTSPTTSVCLRHDDEHTVHTHGEIKRETGNKENLIKIKKNIPNTLTREMYLVQDCSQAKHADKRDIKWKKRRKNGK